MTDLDRLLREGLHAAAAEARPDAAAATAEFRRRRRARHRRRAVGTSAGVAVAAAAVALVAATVGQGADPGERVGTFAPPGTEPAPGAPAAGPSTAAAGRGPHDFVYAHGGGVWRVPAQGGNEQVVDADVVPGPGLALSPSGDTVVYARDDPADASPDELVARDLATGEERPLGAGASPVFAPDGRLAYVAHPPDDTRPLAVVVVSPSFTAEQRLPVGSAADRPHVSGLAWDASGDRLLLAVELAGEPLWLADLRRRSVDPWPVAGTGKSTYVVSSGREPGVFPVVRRAHRPDGAVTGAELGAVALGDTPTYRRTADLPLTVANYPGVALRPGQVAYLRPMGVVDVDMFSDAFFALVPGDAYAYLVGDGKELLLVDEAGHADYLQSGAVFADAGPALVATGPTAATPTSTAQSSATAPEPTEAPQPPGTSGLAAGAGPPPQTAPDRLPWPASGPVGFAAAFADRIEVWDRSGGIHRAHAFPARGAGVAFDVGDEVVFSLREASGAWVYPPATSDDGNASLRGDGVSLFQAPGESTAVLHDVALVGGRPTAVYREVATEAEGLPQRVMLFDLATRESRVLADLEGREGYLTEVSYGGGNFLLTFNLGDSAWFEFVDDEGRTLDVPTNPHPERRAGPIAQGRLSQDGKTLIYTEETGLHSGARVLVAHDLEKGAESGRWNVAEEGETIGFVDVDAEGRWVVASLVRDADDPVLVPVGGGTLAGYVVVDTATGDAVRADVPALVTFRRGG